MPDRSAPEIAAATGFLLLVASLVALLARHSLFALHPASIALQAAAVALMVWARLTLGFRSFNAGAAPTEGGLVTTGPYRFVRHPIYAAILLFVATAVAFHPSAMNVAIFAAAILGASMRMLAEERLVAERYPEYAEYARRTRRLVPFVV